MRDLLFKILDEIEPNEIIQVRMREGYGAVFLANKQSIPPLAIDMRPDRSPFYELEEAYRIALEHDEINEYESSFINDHIIQLDNKNYIINEEILDIEYHDNYFNVTVANPDGITTNYYKYDDIIVIKRIREAARDYIYKYNQLNYQYKNNSKGAN